MANQKRTTRNHAEHLVNLLDPNLRNALRVLLSNDVRLTELRHALGVKTEPITELEYRLGLAKTGRTIELFTGIQRLSPADITEVL